MVLVTRGCPLIYFVLSEVKPTRNKGPGHRLTPTEICLRYQMERLCLWTPQGHVPSLSAATLEAQSPVWSWICRQSLEAGMFGEYHRQIPIIHLDETVLWNSAGHDCTGRE